MSETNRVQPALTPEEWQLRERLGYGNSEEHSRAFLRSVALANDSLPDGHPNRFTREDVAALRHALRDARTYLTTAYGPGNGWGAVPEQVAARNLAAGLAIGKIEALLPPE